MFKNKYHFKKTLVEKENKYGIIASIAVKLLSANKYLSPEEAWLQAAKETTASKQSQKKGCPKRTFIGLYENEKIKNLQTNFRVCNADNNKNLYYALIAIEILKNSNNFVYRPSELWKEVIERSNQNRKTHNGQMDVVLALWNRNYMNY